MNEIPTALEFISNAHDISMENIHYFMIEFAKLHVEAALQEAGEKAYVEFIDLSDNEIFDYTDVITDDNIGANVNQNSILKAYPLENIK